MKQRNLKTARMDLWTGDMNAFRYQVNKIRANGGKVEVALQVGFQWDNSCNPNLAAIEQTAYNETATVMNQTKDIVHYGLLTKSTCALTSIARWPGTAPGTPRRRIRPSPAARH